MVGVFHARRSSFSKHLSLSWSASHKWDVVSLLSPVSAVMCQFVPEVSGGGPELPPVDGGGSGLLHPDGSRGRPAGGALQLLQQEPGQVSHQTHPPQGQVHQVSDSSRHYHVCHSNADFTALNISGALKGTFPACDADFPSRGQLMKLTWSLHFSRVLESLLVATVTTVVIFAASMLLGECRDLSPSSTTNSTVGVRLLLHTHMQAKWDEEGDDSDHRQENSWWWFIIRILTLNQFHTRSFSKGITAVRENVSSWNRT